MESTVAQIRELAISADKPARLEIIRTLHGLAYSLEDEEDVVNRFGFLVCSTTGLQDYKTYCLERLTRIF